MRFSLVLAALAISSAAFAQQDHPFQVGFAANLNIGDSVVNISNDGFRAGVFGAIPATAGNLCANIYVFDPQEEEIGCCACLVTPNGLNSLSAKSDLISNNLTPAVPTSIVIKVLGTLPGQDSTGAITVCNPATTNTILTNTSRGLVVWGTTLEPNSTPGTYNAVAVPFLNASLVGEDVRGGIPVPTPGQEVDGLARLCNFIQANGTGFGICKSCRLGALGGAKQ